jgi:hypothetical protein
MAADDDGNHDENHEADNRKRAQTGKGNDGVAEYFFP